MELAEKHYADLQAPLVREMLLEVRHSSASTGFLPGVEAAQSFKVISSE